jgi:hypothetical protein
MTAFRDRRIKTLNFINQKPMQIAYVLTSNGKDIHADMNLISLRTLRYSNPDAKIVLVCDHETVQSLEKYNHIILKEADEIVSVHTPSQPASFRNRFVKTSLREHLSGDFLYLDADTVIRGDLTEIFNIKSSFAAAPNHSGSGDPAEIPSDETENFKLLGWELPKYYYVNGGVLFFADAPDTYSFCQIWHKKWLASAEKRGSFRDQPSLNSAIADSGVSFSWLPHRFNAQVDARPIYAPDAVIWHLYGSNGGLHTKTVFGQYIDGLQKGENITYRQIEYLCNRQHPWQINYLYRVVLDMIDSYFDSLYSQNFSYTEFKIFYKQVIALTQKFKLNQYVSVYFKFLKRFMALLRFKRKIIFLNAINSIKL